MHSVSQLPSANAGACKRVQLSSMVAEQCSDVGAWYSDLSLSTADSGISLRSSSSLATVVSFSSDKRSPLASSPARSSAAFHRKRQRLMSAATASAADDDDHDDNIAETACGHRCCHRDGADKHVLHSSPTGLLAYTLLLRIFPAICFWNIVDSGRSRFVDMKDTRILKIVFQQSQSVIFCRSGINWINSIEVVTVS